MIPGVLLRVTRACTLGVAHTTGKYGNRQRVFPHNVRFRGWPKKCEKKKLQKERETRHENRELAKQLNEKRKAGRTTASTTPQRFPIVEEPIFQMEPV